MASVGSSSLNSPTSGSVLATAAAAAAEKGSSEQGAAAAASASAAAAADKYKRFENEGVVFKAKLIGSELVMEPRGDKMCQNSIQRLKAIIKGTNSHKKRVVLKISYDGVKVYDEKSNEILHHHEVSQISYIASDDTDNRTFGYVSDVPSKAHQFICFKTSGPAISVMSVISALFEAVLERKNQAEKELKEKEKEKLKQQQQQDSKDLIGDSGFVENDSISEELKNLSVSGGGSGRRQQPSSSSMLDGLVISSGGLPDPFGQPVLGVGGAGGPQPPTTGGGAQSQLAAVHQRGQQSASAADLIFDDLFAGLSDPIIVDKNESLVSYKQQPGAGGGGHGHLQHLQQQHQQQMQTGGLAMSPPSDAFGGSHSSGSFMNPQLSAASAHQQPVEPHHQQVPLRQGAPAPTSGWQIPRRQSQQHHNQKHQVLLPPPSSLPRPVPSMGLAAHNNNNNHSMNNNSYTSQNNNNNNSSSHNRSLVYNHSSVSLSDAALTRQSSFGSSSNPHNTSSDSYVDRYAVFNDIDNLPSIFESVSNSNSTQQYQQQQQQQLQKQQQQQIFRQRNPFDDDFFA